MADPWLIFNGFAVGLALAAGIADYDYGQFEWAAALFILAAINILLIGLSLGGVI